LIFDDAALNANYNRRAFAMGHRLFEHPLFAIETLFDLCRRLRPENVYCRPGKISHDAEFDQSLTGPNGGLSLDDAIAKLEERNAYIVIFNPEIDPVYAPVIEGLLGEIAAHTEHLDPDINWYSSYVFISAHDSVTPYHMDREMNFLLQIQGHKTVMLWDPFDQEIMTDADKDLLLSYQGARRPAWKSSFESKAMTFELQPGVGVHHPFIAPHLVRTSSAVSVSLALTFRSRASDTWTNAHAFNYRLRRLGLVPTPVHRNPAIDRGKSSIMRLIRRARGAPASDQQGAP
jgi:hypothetical protein